MWILTPLQSGGETHYLLPGRDYVVGRKNCDILLPNDQSISRAHAKLTVADQNLTLNDTSKYGTFVNNQRLTAPVNLKSGDDVTFGVFHSKFSVFHQKPVVCSSCLDSTGKGALSQALVALGGKLVNAWTKECTHLAMPSVKVTVKTISALLCCCPIVKPEFFSELNNAYQQKLPPPKAESFVPEIDEPSLNKDEVNLGAMPVRKQLFTGKTFIFLSTKQLKRLSGAVSFGGGRSQLLEEGSLPCDLLESPHSCVVDVLTGSSQTLLPPSSVEWADSVKSILQRKGLRVITESEIGLAAIYASCDKYCNPSCVNSDSDQKLKPRIPSASLSQSVAVDETVLPAASQNITAYAVNTEPSQRMEVCEASGVVAVGETPEKKQNHNYRQSHGSKLTDQSTTTPSVVADTMSSSFNIADSKDSQRKKTDSKATGGGGTYVRSQPSTPKTNGGTKTSLYKQSPQKAKISAQTSPQKQSTLTNFFQPVHKKRPLEDQLSAVMSEPKRPTPESSITVQASNTETKPKEVPPLSLRGPQTVSQTPLESPADLFVGRSEAPSEEPQSRKRKEIEEEIKIEELEYIMSEDMHDFDEKPSSNQGQQEELTMHSSSKQKQDLHSIVSSSSSKRQRVYQEEKVISQERPKLALKKESSFSKNLSTQSGPPVVSVKTKQLHPADFMTTNNESNKPPEMPFASTSKNMKAVEDDQASFIEDVELLEVDLCQEKDETKTSVKPVVVKQEVQESVIDEGLPNKLVLVEFRSLTVSAPHKIKPKQVQENRHVKNFKCFRKKRVPGAEGFPPVIRGSDLLVHNRGKNSDMDEWLQNAAEEERQNRRDESIGDDLFRYNPTKQTKRR
ncbi:nibrin isoform X2 [Melanotaenia boesemani]|uniref:nibrin isoform X2 n=1 Tax=Melanotaenia boesemani TaxID=1250792 RepID=UPI001C05716A|nr:nibrin isoform X2 [Melanotaenia boesemani]